MAAASGASPGALRPDDVSRVMEQFGVSEAQVRRDHAISLILAAISAHHRGDVVFFGGTALGRTFLPSGRLSEDIDLITPGHRAAVAADLTRTVEHALQRTHGRLTWQPGFSPNREVEPAIACTPGGIAIRIQLLSARGYEPWPWMFTTAPTEADWRAQLGGQTRLHVMAAEALVEVARAWVAAIDDGGDDNGG